MVQPFKYLVERDKRKGVVKPAVKPRCDQKIFHKPTRTERQCEKKATLAVRDIKTGLIMNVLCRVHANKLKGLPYGDVRIVKLEEGDS